MGRIRGRREKISRSGPCCLLICRPPAFVSAPFPFLLFEAVGKKKARWWSARWLRPMGDRGGGRDVSQWRANNAVTTRVSLLIRRIISRRHGTRWQTTVWLPALSSNEVRWAITIFSGTKTTTFIWSPTTIFPLISFSIVTLSLAFLFKVYPKGKKIFVATHFSKCVAV